MSFSGDLNTVEGFQSLVGGAVGGASTVLQQLTGAIASNWDIQESSYGHNGNQILFHIFKTAADFDAAVDSVQDTGGHRKIPIVFPYQDGQSTDDLGRKGEIFDFNILIFGPQYKDQYKKLLKELDNPTPGTLFHPVRGKLTVAAEDWIVTHASDKKQAVALRVRFIEHSFSVDYSTIPVSKNVPSALTSAIGFLGSISSALTAIQSIEFVAANTTALVTSLFNGYLSGYTAVLSQLNLTFNSSGSSSVPGLNPTVAGQDPTVFGVASSPSNAFSGTGGVNSTQGSTQLTAALASQQAVDMVSALRTQLETSIEEIEASENGQGALIYFDQILLLKQSANAMQSVLELGLQTSSNTVITYKTPRDMSVREVCFANGLSPDNSYDIEVLNPNLLSLNLIAAGTIVQVPT